MDIVFRKIDKLGRIVLPMDFRRALGLECEAEVLLSISGDTITVRGVEHSCRLCGSTSDVSLRFGNCQKCIEGIRQDSP